MKLCCEPSRFQRLSTPHDACHTPSFNNECLLGLQAPGIQWANGHGPSSTELTFELGNRQAYGPNMSGSILRCPSPVEKALGWETNSAPFMFSVLGQVTTHYRGFHFPNSWIRKLSPWSPGVLPAWMFCDSVSSVSEASSPV